jgi:hypothetical protein
MKLEFKTPPSVIFVSEDGAQKNRLFIGGKEVLGLQSVQINADIESLVALKLEIIAPAAQIKGGCRCVD